MIFVIQAETSNIVAIFRRNRRQKLFHGTNLFCELTVEERALDQVCFDYFAMKAVETDVAGNLNWLSQVSSAILTSDKANDMSRTCHSKYCGSSLGCNTKQTSYGQSGHICKYSEMLFPNT